MTEVHAQVVGDKAVLPVAEFERLIELARRSEDVQLQTQEDNVLTTGIMQLAQVGGAFDWLAEEEDLYTTADLKVRYKNVP